MPEKIDFEPIAFEEEPQKQADGIDFEPIEFEEDAGPADKPIEGLGKEKTFLDRAAEMPVEPTAVGQATVASTPESKVKAGMVALEESIPFPTTTIAGKVRSDIQSLSEGRAPTTQEAEQEIARLQQGKQDIIAQDPLAYNIASAGLGVGPQGVQALGSIAQKGALLAKKGLTKAGLALTPTEAARAVTAPEAQRVLGGLDAPIAPTYSRLADTATQGVKRVEEAAKLGEAAVKEQRAATLADQLNEIKQQKEATIGALKRKELDSLTAKDNLKALAEAEEQAVRIENEAIRTDLEAARQASGQGARVELGSIQNRVRQNIEAVGDARTSYIRTAEEMREPLPEWQDRIVSLENQIDNLLHGGGLTDQQISVARDAMMSVRRKLNTMPGSPMPSKGAYAEEVLALRRTLDEKIPWGSLDPKSKTRTMKEIRNLVNSEVKDPTIDAAGRLREFDVELNKSLASRDMLKSFGKRRDVPVAYESGAIGVRKETTFDAPTRDLSPQNADMLAALVQSGAVTPEQANTLRQQYAVAGRAAVPEQIAARQTGAQVREQGAQGLKSMQEAAAEQAAQKKALGQDFNQIYSDRAARATEAAKAPIRPEDALTPEARRAMESTSAIEANRAQRATSPEYLVGGKTADASGRLEDFRTMLDTDPIAAEAMLKSDPKAADLLELLRNEGKSLIGVLEGTEASKVGDAILARVANMPILNRAARGAAYVAGMGGKSAALSLGQSLAKTQMALDNLGMSQELLRTLPSITVMQMSRVVEQYGVDDPRTKALLTRLAAQGEQQ
jgi:hypothetical protein